MIHLVIACFAFYCVGLFALWLLCRLAFVAIAILIPLAEAAVWLTDWLRQRIASRLRR